MKRWVFSSFYGSLQPGHTLPIGRQCSLQKGPIALLVSGLGCVPSGIGQTATGCTVSRHRLEVGGHAVLE